MRTQHFCLASAGAEPGFQAWGGRLKKLRRKDGGAKILEAFSAKNLSK